MPIRIFLIGLISVTSAMGIYIYQRTKSLDRPIGDPNIPFQIEVKAGSTFKQLVARLSRRKVLTDGTVFELFARFTKQDREIKAGHYLMAGNITPRQMLKEFTKGQPDKSIRVTLPEGWNRWQIADRLSGLNLIDRDRFLRRVKMERLEGRLFPDTYKFVARTDTDVVIDRLLTRHKDVWNQIKAKGRNLEQRLTDDELINLAALAQKESGHLDEQQKIVRVFLNRLGRNMKLQSDPTCVYSSTLYKVKPSPKTCKDKNNRYSTYVIDGLPPTPIGNPGQDALSAALNPFDGKNAQALLFFVARRDGTKRHYFSETYQQHKAAVQKYLKDR